MPIPPNIIDELRDVLAEAEAETARIRAALAMLTGDAVLPASTAQAIVREVAKDRPKPKAKSTSAAKARPGGKPPVDYAEVAEVAIEARERGESMTAAVSKRFNEPESTTRNWLTKARELGYLPRVGPTHAAPASPVEPTRPVWSPAAAASVLEQVGSDDDAA